MAWIFLFIASLFEVAWTFSLKLLDFPKIRRIYWLGFFQSTEGIVALAPLIGYILFGCGNIYCFSMAMKQIPASTAMAVWLGVALVGVKLVDVFVFKQALQTSQIFYLLLILVGVIGLKR